jgi:NhaP-type Na+/H+ and K+/H+ antiporter
VIENLCRLTNSTGRLGIAGVYVASHAAAGDRELKRGHMDVLWATLFHMGLWGAVPIVLATFPLLAGLPKASLLFDQVFFVVLASLLLQGASVPFVARWLGVITPEAVA